MEAGTLGLSPTQIADYVNPNLIGEQKLFGPGLTGIYIGWVRLDAFKAKYAEPIWRTNFPKLEYCTVTVKSDLDDSNYSDQTFMVLKNTEIPIPGNIYHELGADKHFGGWKAVEAQSGEVPSLGKTFTVDEDVTFTARWLQAGEVPVQVLWKDADDADGKRPSSVDFTAKKKDGTTLPITLTGDQSWGGVAHGDVTDIDTTWNYEGSQYSCEKSVKKGAYVFTFTHTPATKTAVGAEVVWDDNNDITGRPMNVTINLYADGHKETSQTITAQNGWKHTFGNLPKYKDGQEIVYSVDEDDVDGYGTSVSGYLIVNTPIVEEPDTIDVTGIVEWDDGNNAQGARPEKVTVHLWNGEQEVGTKEVSAGAYGLWDFWFYDLPATDAEGGEITYTLTADRVAKYKEPIVNDQGKDSFRVTYTFDVPEKQKTPSAIAVEPRAITPVYNGESQALVSAGTAVGGTILYALGMDATTSPAEGEFTIDIPARVDAGTYYVWYFVKGDAFHKDVEPPACIEATIDKRLVTFVGETETEDYTGSAIRIEGVDAEGLVDEHTHNVAFEADGVDVGEYEGKITAQSDVVILADKANVTKNYDVDVASGKLTIRTNSDLELTVSLESASFTSDGKPHALPKTATANAVSGKTTFAYSKDGTAWTSDLASLTATSVADSCTILVRATNPNYANVAQSSADLTITATDTPTPDPKPEPTPDPEPDPAPRPNEEGTLTFDLAGGTIDGKETLTIKANVGDVITIPEAPVRDGYTFKYWKGSEYYPGDKYKVEGDHTFTAVWEKSTKESENNTDGNATNDKDNSNNSDGSDTGGANDANDNDSSNGGGANRPNNGGGSNNSGGNRSNNDGSNGGAGGSTGSGTSGTTVGTSSARTTSATSTPSTADPLGGTIPTLIAVIVCASCMVLCGLRQRRQ